MSEHRHRWRALLLLLLSSNAIAEPADPSAEVPESHGHDVERELVALRQRVAALEADQPTPITSGFSNGRFFIRSQDGAFRISPSLRLQLDGYAYAPRIDAPGAPTTSFLVRRARPEILGAILGGRVELMLAGDFAETRGGAAATDAFVLFHVAPWLNVQVGQFDVPFTFENRTSDRYIEFLERSFVVRNLGTAPKEPGVMVFGLAPDRSLFYSIGLFNGDGINQRNLDDQFDLVGRAFVRPLVRQHTLDRVQLGGSFSTGRRRFLDTAYLGGATTEDGWLTTGSGWSFFRTNYAGSDGMGTPIGVVPSGQTNRLGAEVSVPVGRFAFRSEYIYMAQDVDENLLGTGAVLRRAGELEAHGVYGLLSYWPIGNPRLLPDAGVHSDQRAETPSITDAHHLQLVTRVDYVHARYAPGVDTGPHALGGSQVGGIYRVVDLAVGANLWWTRHVRFSFNYILHHVDGGLAARTPSPDQAVLHELGARVALSL